MNYELENEIKEFGTKAEGVTYLIMTELYSSQYIFRVTDPLPTTELEVLNIWNKNLIDYSLKTEVLISEMLAQVVETYQIGSELDKSGYQERSEFLRKRLLNYIPVID